MGSNLGGDGDGHLALEIWEENQDWFASMERKIWEAPEIQSQSAGGSSCCIFKVPKSLKRVHGERYQPQMISIGPYHHGKQQLAENQKHKWRFLRILLVRTESKKLSLKDYIKAVQPHVAKARECYSEQFGFSEEQFIEMLVLDGCFILELLRKIDGVVKFDAGDPFSMLLKHWTDLILLENQIPFSVLVCLFKLTVMPDEDKPGKDLCSLTLNLIEGIHPRSNETSARSSCTHDGDYKHLLDFLRWTCIPQRLHEAEPGDFHDIRLIPCISRLRRAGIDFKPGKDDSFLVVKFRKGVFEIPPICLSDAMRTFLMNCVAYEQCQLTISSPQHITAYVVLLDCLIDTDRDVQFLRDRKIIDSYFGSDAEAAEFVNKMSKKVGIFIERCYLANVFQDVNKYYHNNWHVHRASFKDWYFKSPWIFISALAAFVLLVLALLQTIYTILSYVKSN